MLDPERREVSMPKFPPPDAEKLKKYSPIEQRTIVWFYEDQYPTAIMSVLREYDINPNEQPPETWPHEVLDKIKDKKDEVLEQAMSLFEVQRDAMTDENTGLYKERAFVSFFRWQTRELARKETQKCSALMFIDLDHLKRINDSFGHVVADQLLALVGEKLRSVPRPSDTACRCGGDEFILMLNQMALQESKDPMAHFKNVREAATRIFKSLSQIAVVKNEADPKDIRIIETPSAPDTVVEFGGKQYRIIEKASFSIGIKVIEPGDLGLDEERGPAQFYSETKNQAEAAAYFSKQVQGRNSLTIVTSVNADGKMHGTSLNFDTETNTFVPAKDGETEIKRLHEYEATREVISKQVFEALNRLLGCVTARHKGKIPERLRQTIVALSEQIFEECYEPGGAKK